MSKRNATPAFNTNAMSRMNMRDMLVMPETAGQAVLDINRFEDTDPTTDGAKLEATSIANLEAAYSFRPQDDEDRKPFVYQDGIAVIPIHGTLLNRCNWSWGFVTGYQYIRRMMNTARRRRAAWRDATRRARSRSAVACP